MLDHLAGIAGRAAALAAFIAERPHPVDLPARRLAPDMLSLAENVVVLADGLVGALAIAAGRGDHPAAGTVFNRGFGMDLGALAGTMAEAAARLQDAAEETRLLLPAALAGSLPDPVRVERPGDVRLFAAASFLPDFVVPNGEFHLAMIYAIARSAAVPLGKRQFEGPQTWWRPGDARPARSRQRGTFPRR